MIIFGFNFLYAYFLLSLFVSVFGTVSFALELPVCGHHGSKKFCNCPRNGGRRQLAFHYPKWRTTLSETTTSHMAERRNGHYIRNQFGLGIAISGGFVLCGFDFVFLRIP